MAAHLQNSTVWDRARPHTTLDVSNIDGDWDGNVLVQWIFLEDRVPSFLQSFQSFHDLWSTQACIISQEREIPSDDKRAHGGFVHQRDTQKPKGQSTRSRTAGTHLHSLGDGIDAFIPSASMRSFALDGNSEPCLHRVIGCRVRQSTSTSICTLAEYISAHS